MHELSRMDDEAGDPLPGDRRLCTLFKSDLPFGAVAPNGCSEQRHTTNPEELEIRLSCFKSRNHVPLWRYLKEIIEMMNKINSVCVYCVRAQEWKFVYFDAARELGALLATADR